ncbi:putative tyrosinase [Achaetomium macrosporum]|uniref:Tyrosinase n=1 Tax=Achaetomium macrosporum TaxID=79813 RepID=A0AAN7HA01_9PEZI|nr:putative tyrosinase [Achaetomium macrosporum]
MHLATHVVGLLAVLSAAEAYEPRPAPTKDTDRLAAQALSNLTRYQKSSNPYGACTVAKAARRKEWGSLSTAERKDYIRAVQCLMRKPSKYDPKAAPGAKTRYDDFVAVHINQTLSIHGTANFLSWHRWFVYTFEQALRNECGYKGWQPYWNWGRWANDPLNSPIFDGSDTSMSGNGAYAPHNCTPALPTGLNCIPPGNGGGCIFSGPFANMSVNLGPVAPTLQVAGNVPVPSLLAYNPRCVRRDITNWVSRRWTTEQNTTDLITQSADIGTFQTTMQGDFSTGFYGVHVGGHFTFGGDPGGDLFASPGDPAFWLHHGQIDRVWWIWQNLNPAKRTQVIAGTLTVNNSPPSRNGTLNDIIDLEVNAAPLKIKDVVSTVGIGGGPLCYVYV